MINKPIAYLINIIAIIFCFLVGIVYLRDGSMYLAGLQFSLVVLNTGTIIWLYRMKL